MLLASVDCEGATKLHPRVPRLHGRAGMDNDRPDHDGICDRLVDSGADAAKMIEIRIEIILAIHQPKAVARRGVGWSAQHTPAALTMLSQRSERTLLESSLRTTEIHHP